MGFEDLRIRDISRATGEWSPPIGALGGPPAHELYRDLVIYAGLQLFQDARSCPWVVFRDGVQRRAFLVPSVELRGALDRFRMHRNSRPVPENDLEEFVRIVEARVSDPDVPIPVLRAPFAERSTAPEGTADPVGAGGGVPAASAEGAPPSGPASPLDDGDDPTFPSGTGSTISVPAPDPRSSNGSRPPEAGTMVSTAISGGWSLPSRETANVARYVRVLRRLVRDRDWMGTIRELSEVTRDDPLTVYGSLLRFRSELANNDLLFTTIDAGDGIRWLVIDGSRFRNGAVGRPGRARPSQGK